MKIFSCHLTFRLLHNQLSKSIYQSSVRTIFNAEVLPIVKICRRQIFREKRSSYFERKGNTVEITYSRNMMWACKTSRPRCKLGGNISAVKYLSRRTPRHGSYHSIGVRAWREIYHARYIAISSTFAVEYVTFHTTITQVDPFLLSCSLSSFVYYSKEIFFTNKYI